MEYIIVKVAGKEKECFDVLINAEKNGMTNEILQLEEGYVEVSVDLENAEVKEIELYDTTVNNPMEVIISCA